MNLADKITSLRIVLVPVFVSLLLYADNISWALNAAVFIFFIAILSDFFDGLAARIKKEKSDIGQILDPLADKLLMLSSFICLYALRSSLPLSYKLPLGVLLIVVGRDVVLGVGLLALHILRREVSINPSIWGKLTTFFQMMTIFTLLINSAIFLYVWKLAAIFTLISGVDYFIRGVKATNGDSKLTNI